MAKKIIKGVGKALGIGKKKQSADPAEDDATHKPIITELPGQPQRRKARRGPTILGGESDTLG